MKNLTYDIEKRCFVDASSRLLLGGHLHLDLCILNCLENANYDNPPV